MSRGEDLFGLHHQSLAVAGRQFRLPIQGFGDSCHDTFVRPAGAGDRRRRLPGPAVHQTPQSLGLVALPHPQKCPLAELLSASRQLGDLRGLALQQGPPGRVVLRPRRGAFRRIWRQPGEHLHDMPFPEPGLFDDRWGQGVHQRER
ncbi:hypothetical protein [Streptomyces acidicola]|uniref:hypothetical protein n=1 Tax=Streptomyces acidicola TaxID=2596892 RepID=UPI003432E298